MQKPIFSLSRNVSLLCGSSALLVAFDMLKISSEGVTTGVQAIVRGTKNMGENENAGIKSCPQFAYICVSFDSVILRD